jgi:hypothetical protein
MTRLIGPDESCRLVYLPSGIAKAQGRPVTIYSDVDGTQAADIRDENGSPVVDSKLTIDGYSRVPLFQFPDGLDTVYGQVDGGPVSPLYARVDDRLDALTQLSWVSVKVHGAVGDGVADDSAAILSAIDDVSVNGGAVYFPAGRYKSNTTIPLRSNLSLIGDSDAASTIAFTSTATSGMTGAALNRVSILNLRFVGPGIGSGSGNSGLVLTKGANPCVPSVSIRDSTFEAFGQDGVSIENAITTVFDRVELVNCGRYGLNLFGQNPGSAAGTSVVLSGVYGNTNGVAGIRIFNMVYTALSGCAVDGNPVGYLIDTCQSLALTGCGAEGNTVGLRVNSGYGITTTSLWVFDNHGTGIDITGSAQTVSLIGCTDNSPGVGSTNFIKTSAGSSVALLHCSNDSPNSLAAGTTNILTDSGGGAVIRAYTVLGGGGEFNGDLACYTASRGVVLTDRVNGGQYRLKVTSGVLGVEAV